MKIVKKLSVLMAVFCALMVAIPMSADAGLNIGNVLKGKPTVKTEKPSGGKVNPAAPVKQGGKATITITCDGAPLQYANAYIGPGIEYRLEDGKCHVINKSSMGGMTSDKGVVEVEYTQQGCNIVIFKVGFEPILLRNVALPSTHNLTTTKNPAVKGVKFD